MASEVKNAMYFDLNILAWLLLMSKIFGNICLEILWTFVYLEIRLVIFLLVKKLKLSHEYHNFLCNTCIYMYCIRDYELKNWIEQNIPVSAQELYVDRFEWCAIYIEFYWKINNFICFFKWISPCLHAARGFMFMSF